MCQMEELENTKKMIKQKNVYRKAKIRFISILGSHPNISSIMRKKILPRSCRKTHKNSKLHKIEPFVNNMNIKVEKPALFL